MFVDLCLPGGAHALTVLVLPLKHYMFKNPVNNFDIDGHLLWQHFAWRSGAL